jgi:Tfp pilus assembly protein PilV
MPRTNVRSSAFSLPEVLAAAMVLTLAVAALMQAVVAGQRQSHSALRATRATALNDALMAEIQANPYDDPDNNEANEDTRARFDDIDDYDGYSETFDQTIADAGGSAYPQAYQSFRRSVTVQKATFTPDDLGTQQPGKRIIITTTHTTGQTWTVTRFVPEPADDNQNN